MRPLNRTAHNFKVIRATMSRLTELWSTDQPEYENRDWLPEFIANKMRQKALKRRRASIRLMKAYKGLYDCRECIHGLIRSCLDALPNGCEYFSDEVTGRRFAK